MRRERDASWILAVLLLLALISASAWFLWTRFVQTLFSPSVYHLGY